MSIMLSEIKNLCKRLVEWLKTNERPDRRGGGELYLAAVIILVAVISFGLGRLSKIREEKTPITITETPLSTSNVDSGKTSNKNVTEKMLEQNFGNIAQSPKIFVASKNGKKYYYAWCESANVIKEQNRVWFSAKDEAEKAGYTPAANCRGLK